MAGLDFAQCGGTLFFGFTVETVIALRVEATPRMDGRDSFECCCGGDMLLLCKWIVVSF